MSLPTLTLLKTDISALTTKRRRIDERSEGLTPSVIIKDKREPPPSAPLNLIFPTRTDEDKISFVTWLIDKLIEDQNLQDATGFEWKSVKDLQGTTFVYAESMYGQDNTVSFEYDSAHSKLVLFHLIKQGRLNSAFGYTHGGSFLLIFSGEID